MALGVPERRDRELSVRPPYAGEQRRLCSKGSGKVSRGQTSKQGLPSRNSWACCSSSCVVWELMLQRVFSHNVASAFLRHPFMTEQRSWRMYQRTSKGRESRHAGGHNHVGRR
jgi:hypothetical protein